jgi:hypothetical protein
MSLPACMLLVYIIQKAYLRTSRQLRFLELEYRAEVFSDFLEAVSIQLPMNMDLLNFFDLID